MSDKYLRYPLVIDKFPHVLLSVDAQVRNGYVFLLWNLWVGNTLACYELLIQLNIVEMIHIERESYAIKENQSALGLLF